MKPSHYVIPCPCGATVESHEREATCPTCGRLLAVEWGREPETHIGKPSQSTLFDTAPSALEPTR